MKYIIILLVCLSFPLMVLAELPVGKKPPRIELSGKLGGKIDGSPWSSDELTGKLMVLFYVDPDEKNMNEHVSQALKKAASPKSKVGSVAIVNMDATWLPNVAIESMLKKKQKQYSHTIYVKDFAKVLVKKWKLRDNSSNIVLFDKDGKVLFSKDGKFSQDDVDKLLGTIQDNLD